MRIAREALPFVLPLLLGAFAAVFFSRPWVGGGLLALTLFVLYFFRDPSRSFEGPPDLVLSPADGTVLSIDRVVDPHLNEIVGRQFATHRVVIFLSVFNVHLQRTPTEGFVLGSHRKAGRRVAAFREGADEVNEGHLTVLRRAEGDIVGIWQIVGLVARRIVPYLEAGDRVERGEHLGLIRFGSRVDLLVPDSYEVMVKEGDRVRGGLTPMAMPTDPSSNPPP